MMAETPALRQIAPDLPPLSLALSIPARFRQVAALVPDHPAVVDGDQCITYAALDAWSDRVAGAIHAHSGAAVAPVALLCAHGPAVLAAMLGVLKAGRIYGVVDPAMPAARLAHILADLAADLLLADRSQLALAHSLERPAGCVLEIEALALAVSPLGLRSSPAIDDLAAIYYSSGTTGQPKGILRDHAALVHRAWVDAEVVPLGPGDAVAWLYSAAYSASVADIFGALLNGAALHVYRLHAGGIGALAQWLERQRITSLHLHASVLRQLLDAVPDDQVFPQLCYVRPSDRVAIGDLRRLRRHLPDGAIIAHSLGSSETGPVARLVCREDAPLEGETTPVGFPLSTVEISLLDEAGQPVVDGGIGEIVVRSRYLARGYWRQPELTAQRFQRDSTDPHARIYRMGDLARYRPDGMLELVGRNDRRVKMRGYTVDLGAVEAALAAQPGVAEAAVVVQGQSEHARRLVAYVVWADGHTGGAAALHAALTGQIPSYMLPARIAAVETLPRQPNGKVDRSALPAIDQARPELPTPFVAPRNELEQQIAGLWAELLELDSVGMEDNFFALGGDSILAMRMILVVEKATGLVIPPDFFRTPTLATLVRLASAETTGGIIAPEFPAALVSGARRDRVRTPPAGDPVPINTLLRWAICRLVLRMTYRKGVSWLGWLGRPATADRLFGNERRWLQQLAAELGQPEAASEEAFGASITGNILRRCFRESRVRQWVGAGDRLTAMRDGPERLWRTFAADFERTAPAERSSIFRFIGLEHLVHAQRQGRGAILLSYHNTGSALAGVILARQSGLGHIPATSLVRAEQMVAEEWDDEDALRQRATAGWAAAYALQAQRTLQGGGVVRIVNDISYDDANALERTIGRRRYALKSGFAELALATGAAVLPVVSSIDRMGCVHLRVLPALTPPAPAAGRPAQIAHLLDQYVTFLERAWREAPASVGWGALHRYIHRPLDPDR